MERGGSSLSLPSLPFPLRPCLPPGESGPRQVLVKTPGLFSVDGEHRGGHSPSARGGEGGCGRPHPLPHSTAVSELERTKGTRLLNRNIA